MEFLKAMLAKMDATQERIDANTKAMQEIMNEMKDEIKEDTNGNRKANREDLREMMEEMMNTNQAKENTNLNELREEITSGQVEMGSILNALIVDMKKN
jgi:F0F1-type ATP synthase membrane subunit b/b'